MSRRDRISDFTRPVARNRVSDSRHVYTVHPAPRSAEVIDPAIKPNRTVNRQKPTAIPSHPRQDRSRVLRRQGLQKLPPFTPVKTRKMPSARLIASLSVVAFISLATPVLIYKSFVQNNGFVQGVKKMVTGNDLPKYMTARSLMDVPAKVGVVSETESMALPATQLGWYQESARPGNNGVSLLIGRVGGDDGIGALRQVKNMKQGDMIRVETGDGGLFVYRVKTIKQLEPQEITKDILLAPAQEGKSGLNIATVIDSESTDPLYSSKRVVVFAVQE